MFIHSLRYAMITMLRNQNFWLWSFIFPVALGTFMYIAFGNLYKTEEIFNEIPVAVVREADKPELDAMLDELSKEDGDRLLLVSYMNSEDAESALTSDTVKGIIYVTKDDIKLKLVESDYEGAVLKTVVDEYKKREKVITDIAATNPAEVYKAVENMSQDRTFFKEISSSDGNQDVTTNYFYAVFAMSCLFASFASVQKIINMQADTSPLGMRRCLSARNKITEITAEFISMFVMQFAIELVTLMYFTMLGIDFGDKYIAIIIILALGVCIGISMGIIVGAIPFIKEKTKTGICTLMSMSFSVMADICVSGIKDAIEHTVPIINRINPAVLISDSFYALNVYDTYDRYIGNMAILGGLSFIMVTVSFLMLRRTKYASV